MASGKKPRRAPVHDRRAARQATTRGRERSITIGAMLVIALPLAFMSRSESSQYVDPQILYESTLERNPRCWLCYDNLGVLLTADDPQNAVLLFRRALAENPDDQDVHYNLGNVLLQMGKVDEGAAELKIAVRTKPAFAEAHDNLGTALARLSDYAGAEREFRTALSLKPTLTGTHTNLGRLLQMTKRPAEAVTEYRLALKAQPSVPEAHANLANSLFDAGEFAEAAKEYQEALRLNPGYTDARDGLTRALAKIKGS